jgi:hypothetical protein
LFIALAGAPKRLRVNGTAQLSFDDPLIASFEGAQALVRVTPEHIFPNCPRYIPDMQSGEPSPYVPLPGAERKEPAWKGFEDFSAVLPPRRA